jgi:hypothetical protein
MHGTNNVKLTTDIFMGFINKYYIFRVTIKMYLFFVLLK